MSAGIYRITCVPTGRFYIGSSVNISARFNGHKRSLNRGCHHSRFLQRAYNKHGADAFKYEILAFIHDRNEREAIEQHLLDSLQPFGATGFNCSRQVGTTKGVIPTAETRKKLSLAGKGRKCSEETKRLLSEQRRGIDPNKGVTTARQLEVRRANKTWLGKKRDQKTIDAIRAFRSKPVAQLDSEMNLVSTFKSATDASIKMGLNRSTVNFAAASGFRYKAAGFFWKYLDGTAV